MIGVERPRIAFSATGEFDAVYPRILASLRPTYSVWYWREEGARNDRPESHCRKMIRNAKGVGLLLGYQYGSKRKGLNYSYCEWEYNLADGPHPVPGILPFTKKGWQTYAEGPQHKHISRVTDFSKGRWAGEFGDDNELVNTVKKSIIRWDIVYIREFIMPFNKLHYAVSLLIGLGIIFCGLFLVDAATTNSTSNLLTPIRLTIAVISLMGMAIAALVGYGLNK